MAELDSEFFDMVGKAGVDEPIPLPKPAVASNIVEKALLDATGGRLKFSMGSKGGLASPLGGGMPYHLSAFAMVAVCAAIYLLWNGVRKHRRMRASAHQRKR